jgi:hypothetical protein
MQVFSYPSLWWELLAMSASSTRVTLTVRLFDGSEHLITARASDTVGHLHQIIATQLALLKPTISCEGEVLTAPAFSTLVSTLPSCELRAWSMVRGHKNAPTHEPVPRLVRTSFTIRTSRACCTALLEVRCRGGGAPEARASSRGQHRSKRADSVAGCAAAHHRCNTRGTRCSQSGSTGLMVEAGFVVDALDYSELR